MAMGAEAQSAPRTPAPAERVAITAGDLASARPEGISASVRIDGDDVAAFHRLLASGRRTAEPWLVLSGGGENGAFAAGLLDGWTRSGDRPVFGVVTGVSTGAMIAPFAFLGSGEDETLRRAYTEITAADIFEFGGSRDSLTDTWPLKRMIERSVTPELLRRIAAAQGEGRRLLVVTTEIDAGRPVVWDMGAIAAEGSPQALKLFREVILASASIPGIFPPVLLDAKDRRGRAIQEMHADGGTTAPFFLAPAANILGDAPGGLPAQRVYLVVNTRADADFEMTQRTLLSVLGRSMTAMIRAQTQAALALSRSYAARTGLEFEIAQIDGRFTQRSPAPFDQGYMRALYRHASDIASARTAFHDAAPAAAATARSPRHADPVTTATIQAVSQQGAGWGQRER